MVLDLIGNSGSAIGINFARHRLAACRTMLQKYALGDRCQLFVAAGNRFSLIPPGVYSESQSCESAMEETVSGCSEDQHPELMFYGLHSGVVAFTKRELYETISDSELTSHGYDKYLVDAECTHDGSLESSSVKTPHQWFQTTKSRRVTHLQHLQFNCCPK
ncbi:S-adenosyl-L-methionine-dependent methyltransferase superfamily protein [Quillaja saponaria]|uniref:S-adenosyl-L-methionine-dependent methyltransferase superfamily protein n=1 Tax=Quillaja saponaria TaxID=32244 RepID=A0AAD7P6N9_QUISA|nr:S-adenosyl-L-methionine-dependent methyltransferase superfamily protein [Quillaja saponaria]